MNSSNVVVLAGVLALAPAAAQAADMPALLEKAPIIEDFGGWYLRGDIGITNQQLGELYRESTPFRTISYDFLNKGEFQAGWLFGVGVGYQFNNWLRADVTGEYRTPTSFHAVDAYVPITGAPGSNDYTAKKSEWLVLANIYLDLGTWWNVTPFIGAGVGTAQVTITDFNDRNLSNNGGGWGENNSEWNFAWALHAGFAYRVSSAITLELAYRYLSLGDGKTGPMANYNAGSTQFTDPNIFQDITSHDVKVAVRWALGGYDAPVVRKY